MKRVITYIDGYNLYFGLKAKNWKRFYWINLQLLAQNLLKPDQELITTKYFTSIVSYPIDKAKRQMTFIEAPETLSNFKLFYGKFHRNPRFCHKCKFKNIIPSEKMTDVNIAVEMLTDAYQDNFDVALLISADSDLSPAIRAIKELFPEKRLVVAFPPERYSVELTKHAHAYINIGRAKIAKSIFPDRIQKADGFVLHRPVSWK